MLCVSCTYGGYCLEERVVSIGTVDMVDDGDDDGDVDGDDDDTVDDDDANDDAGSVLELEVVLISTV